MADKNITALTAAGTLTGAELAKIVQGGNSRKATLSAIAALSAAPTWQLLGGAYTSPGIWLQSSDGSAATVDFTGLAGALDIRFIVNAVTLANSGQIGFRCSSDNGATFPATSADYESITTTGTVTGSDGPLLYSTAATAARYATGQVALAAVNGVHKILETIHRVDTVKSWFIRNTSPINAIRFFGSAAGNLTGGAIYCLVRK